MRSSKKVNMTTSEVASLWAQYVNDTMAICILKYFLNKVDDRDIDHVLKYAIKLSENHINEITDFFKEENITIPVGFTDKDVNIDAPRLYSDTFFIFYLTSMAKMGLATYSKALPNSAREDIRKHFIDSLNASAKLYNKSVDLLLAKGIYTRSPNAALTKNIDFIDDNNFLSNWFGKKRSLLAIEVTHLLENILTNAIGKPLLIGFEQVARTKEVKEFMNRGKEIATKHVEVFSDTLAKEDIPAPIPADTFVTDSTTAPFSDKLMMFHALALIGAGIGNYGASIAVSLRDDIIADYTRLLGEIGKYSKDGIDIMIKNKWMEQPPQVINHDRLNNPKE